MIIFGLSVFYFGTAATGMFHCQNCGGDRAYRLKVARRWFTLFFAPVIPLDEVGKVVRCETCRLRYDPRVLTVPTAAEMAAALPVGMRAVAGVVLRVGGTSDAAVRRAAEAVRATGAEYGPSALRADVSQPLKTADDHLRRLGAQLAPQAREWYLAEAVRIALADGPLTDDERAAVLAVAGSLAMTPAHAHGVMATADQGTGAV